MMDDLQMAQDWLNREKPMMAMAHLQMWYAKQHRAYQEVAIERNRAMAEQIKSQPPPPPPNCLPFPSF